MTTRYKKPKLTPEIRAYMAALGRRSKGGGRPRIPDDQMDETQRARRERYESEIKSGKIPAPRYLRATD